MISLISADKNERVQVHVMWGYMSVEIPNHEETVNTGRYKTTMYWIFKQEESPKYFKDCTLKAEEKHAHSLSTLNFSKMKLKIEANTLFFLRIHEQICPLRWG